MKLKNEGYYKIKPVRICRNFIPGRTRKQKKNGSLLYFKKGGYVEMLYEAIKILSLGYCVFK